MACVLVEDGMLELTTQVTQDSMMSVVNCQAVETSSLAGGCSVETLITQTRPLANQKRSNDQAFTKKQYAVSIFQPIPKDKQTQTVEVKSQ